MGLVEDIKFALWWIDFYGKTCEHCIAADYYIQPLPPPPKAKEEKQVNEYFTTVSLLTIISSKLIF